MYIQSVSIKNFKSIGNDNSTIVLEPNITTIIGKNESGKSNILEGLSLISLLESMPTAFSPDNINRNNGTKAEIQFTIVLSPTPKEREIHNIHNESLVIISKDSYTCTGGILEYYDKNIRESANILISLLGDNLFRLKDQDLKSYRDYIEAFQQSDFINLRKINQSFKFFEARVPKIDIKNNSAVLAALTGLKSKWEVLRQLLPNVFFRNADKTLRTQYRLEEVQKELENPAMYPNSLLSSFVHLIGISNEDFITATQAGVTGAKTTIRNKINKNVESIINQEFQNFYKAESISLKVDMDTNVVSFSVQTGNGEAMLLSERSNGLRWYLNMFIDAISHGITNNNTIFLFDEPGTSLHVNAQKELLHLFHDLADKGNQVVYTTHSPYMLDIKDGGIHRIRAVEKNEYGYTFIFKTAYDAQLSPNSQEDTLAPIINAIGMNLNDAFGPSKEKMNIVIEGVSDYIYISTLAKQLGYNEKFSFIPSVGATNCINICTILFGWGCPFYAVFDYDNEGVTKGGEVLRKEFLCEFGKHYCYIKPITQEDVDSRNFKKHPYVIEDAITKEELQNFVLSKNIKEDISKPLLAKLFCNAIEDGSYSFGQQCKDNFLALFKQITESYE